MSLMQESSENYKREKKEMLLVVVGIVALLFFVVLTIIMRGGVAAIGNFIDVPTFIYMTVIFVLALAIAGMFKDFITAFPTALKKGITVSKFQIQPSLLATKTVILCANLAGILLFVIGLVVSLKVWSGMDNEPEALPIWIAVALLSIVYALVIILILIPIYMRLKGKLIEE